MKTIWGKLCAYEYGGGEPLLNFVWVRLGVKGGR